MRTIVRNNDDQKKLEQNGFVKIELFTTNLYEKFSKVLDKIPQSIENTDYQNLLNNSLQSKLEYKLVNFFPVYYEIIDKSSNDAILIANNPICNENLEKSICILIPLSSKKSNSTVFVLNKGHYINNFPRKDFQININPKINQNLKKINLKRNEALVFYNNLPFMLDKNNQFLKVSLIAYESKLYVFFSKNDCYRGYRLSEESFTNYMLKNKEDLVFPKRYLEFEKTELDLNFLSKETILGYLRNIFPFTK
jgi:hypothetical protein